MLIRQKAFKVIKARLAIVLVIVHFNFDKLFILYTDTLSGGIGAVLHQKGDDERE